jgi:hypothetical protein
MQPASLADPALAELPDKETDGGKFSASSLTRRTLVALSAMTGVSLLAGGADAKKKKKKKKKKFVVQALNMKGSNEVPPNPGDPMASGTASFTVDPKKGSICATFTFQTTTPNSTVTMTHIHQGGPTVNGPVVIDFHGVLQECVQADKALLAELKANPGGFYANIHTNNFTGGAVREQLAEVVKA